MNILTQEVITEPKLWPLYVVASVFVLAIVVVLKYCALYDTWVHTKYFLFRLFVVGTVCCFMTHVFCNTFYRTETDRNRYTATIDDSVTVNELFENYTNITYTDGVYIFEDKEN